MCRGLVFFVRGNLEQAADEAVLVDVDLFGRRNFRQAGHTHHVSGDGNQEAGAGCDFDFADGGHEIPGAATQTRLVRKGALGFGDADGQLLQPQPPDLVQILQGARGVFHRGGSVDARGDDLDLFAHALFPVVQGLVVIRAVIGRGCDEFGQFLGPGPALFPGVHDRGLHAHELAVVQDDLVLFLGVRGETVYGDDGCQIEEAYVLHLLGEVFEAPGQGPGVGHGEVRQVHATVVFEGPHRGHQDYGAGVEARGLAFDVQEFFPSQVESETGFRDHVVGQAQARARGDDRVGALSDVGEGAAVHDGGVALQGLDQVGFDGVLEQGGHGSLGVQVAGVYGFADVGEADEDVAQSLFQVRQVVGQAEDGHDLRGRGDVEARLARNAVGQTAKAADKAPEGPVVHVHDPFPGHGAAVEVEGSVLALQVVVDEGGQEVVGLFDGGEVPSEMEVDVLHGEQLGVAAARGAALDAEDRAQGRLAQHDHGFFADAVQAVGQANGNRGLAFTGRGGRDGRDEDELAVFVLVPFGQGQGQLGLELAVGLELVVLEAEFGRNVSDMEHFCLLGDGDVRSGAGGHVALLAYS